MHNVRYLKEDYIIDVRVMDNNSVYSGKLTLTPTKCFIEIFTERELSPDFRRSESLKCMSTGDNNAYLLFGLEFRQYSNSFLQMKEHEIISKSSLKFNIKFAIFIDGNLPSIEKDIKSFTINSPFIKKWTMHTKTQSELLNNYLLNKGFDTYSGIEFQKTIKNYGTVGIYYSSRQFTNIDELNSGLKINQNMTLTFKNKLNSEKIYDEFFKLYQLLTLFNGGDFLIDHVDIDFENLGNVSASLYFPSKDFKDRNNYTILPLGKDVIYTDQRLNPLPLDLFNKYYALPEEKKELFKRYLKYKRINAPEEKFLGYFRLLEKLTYKSKSYVDEESLKNLLKRARPYLVKKLSTNSKTITDLSKRIQYLNNSKYNTEKCIADFFDTIPIDISNKLEFGKSQIKNITDLRNNITHANDYFIHDYILYRYTNFVDSLLFLAITNLLLDIPLETCIPIANRLKKIR